MKQYYYLYRDSEFVVVVAQPDTDRVGLLGVSFTGENRAMSYVEYLNDKEADRVDDG